MSQRKTSKIVVIGVLAAVVVLIYFIGPSSPAGRYEMKLPPMPMIVGTLTNAQQLHIYCRLSDGKVTIVSGRDTADFGSYQRTANGWLMVFGRADAGTVITNQVEANWFGLKVTLMGSTRSQTLPRCIHFWK